MSESSVVQVSGGSQENVYPAGGGRHYCIDYFDNGWIMIYVWDESTGSGYRTIKLSPDEIR